MRTLAAIAIAPLAVPVLTVLFGPWTIVIACRAITFPKVSPSGFR
jgi:hypothetical protein